MSIFAGPQAHQLSMNRRVTFKAEIRGENGPEQSCPVQPTNGPPASSVEFRLGTII